MFNERQKNLKIKEKNSTNLNSFFVYKLFTKLKWETGTEFLKSNIFGFF